MPGGLGVEELDQRNWSSKLQGVCRDHGAAGAGAVDYREFAGTMEQLELEQ